MGEIGVLKGPKKKCRIIRVVGLTVVGLTVLHCILNEIISKWRKYAEDVFSEPDREYIRALENV